MKHKIPNGVTVNLNNLFFYRTVVMNQASHFIKEKVSFWQKCKLPESCLKIQTTPY